MDPHKVAHTFFFEGLPAGYLSGEALPQGTGNFRYVPYRGPGHHNLGQALKLHGPQRCHYLASGEERHFTVVKWISYGLLELAGFEDV